MSSPSAAESLRRDLGKRGSFDSIEQEAMLSILRTSDLLENRLARLLREHSLTPSQYNVLRILRGEATPMPCLEIASRMIQVAPAITRVVDQLIDRELAGKEQSSDDRRVFLVTITPAGKRLLRRIDKPIDQLHRSLLSAVPKQKLVELTKILATARESIHGT